MHRCKEKFIFAVLFFAGINCNAQSQSAVSPVAPVSPVVPVPKISGINMPSVPQISSSASSGDFYRPGQKNKNTKSQSVSKTTTEASSVVSKNTSLNNTGTYLDKLTDLSARDISELSEQGLFSNLTSLLGTNSGLAGTGISGSLSQNQNLVLNQILKELQEIKKTQGQLALQSKAKSSVQEKSLCPKILRFVINGQDILKSCSEIYFSSVENDGSFFLTGDCRTLYSNHPLTETFYMLFKTAGTKDGKILFNVETNLSQSYENKNSALSIFCTQSKLVAGKTGNLINLRQTDGSIKSDLLIDIGQ